MSTNRVTSVTLPVYGLCTYGHNGLVDIITVIVDCVVCVSPVGLPYRPVRILALRRPVDLTVLGGVIEVATAMRVVGTRGIVMVGKPFAKC